MTTLKNLFYLSYVFNRQFWVLLRCGFSVADKGKVCWLFHLLNHREHFLERALTLLVYCVNDSNINLARSFSKSRLAVCASKINKMNVK